MRLGQYPRYRSNNIEWLPVLPNTWQHIRARFVLGVNPSPVKQRELDDSAEVSFVPMEALGEYGGLSLDRTKSLDEIGSGYTEFEDGDVVVAKITPCFENGKGALASGLVNGVAYGTTELHVLRAGKRLGRRFLFYLTMSHTFRALGESEMYGAGGQKRVPPEFVKNFRIPLPSLDAQQRISRFLDVHTARIDMLAIKKQDIIEKLKEKRSALISRTVTQGLPPMEAKAAGLDQNPEMKNSGIEWLGRIPTHWRCLPIFRIAESIQTGPFGSQLHQADYVEDEVPLINPIHLIEGELRPDIRNTVTSDTAARLARYALVQGDIVFARRGEIGRCGVVRKEQSGWVCGTGSMVVRLNNAEPNYFSLVFRSAGFCSLLELNAVGTTMLNLNPAIVGRMIVPVPSLLEQQKIVMFLERETRNIDVLIAKIESAITHLIEYRQSLITSAVTGNIDVRHWQAPELQPA